MSVSSDNMPRIRLTQDEYELIQQYRDIKKQAYGKIEENGDELFITSNIAKSLDDLVKEYKIDINIWECISFDPGAWTTPVKTRFQLKNSNNEDINVTLPTIIENRKSQAKFKKRIQIIDYNKFRKELIKDIKKNSPYIPTIHKNIKKTGNILEVNIPDLHLGKLAWGEETGEDNYDIKVAVRRFKNALQYLVQEACSENKFEKILFIVGNDLFNSDNAYPYTQTTAGTPQQDDVRWQKVFRMGRNMIIESIDFLKQVAPVKVLIVPGNHDFQKSFYLGDVLDARFYNDKNVEIDNSPKTRKYFKWGKCLLGFTHGNRKDEGESRLLNLMQNEQSENWSNTIFREWHCGDIHHYKEVVKGSKSKNNGVYKYAEDIDSVVIKYLRTLMFNDEWEARKGYKSQKGAHCFVWNKEDGNTKEYKYNK